MRSVVGRMLRPSLSVAFSQWRDYVRVGREQRRLMGLMADVRRRAMLGTALSLWRRHTQSLSTAAIQMVSIIALILSLILPGRLKLAPYPFLF